MDIKILDCTIRDGGHLNNWSFSPEYAAASYYAAVKSGVEYFEIGYRSPSSKVGLGNFGYCRDDFLSEFIEPSNECKIIVMLDANKTDDSSFNKRENSIIRGVRIASYPDDIEKSIEISEKLEDKGYEIFLHLMVFPEYKSHHLKILEKWQRKDIPIYIADSFGTLLPNDIPVYIRKIREIGFNNLGFHAHNNLQLALANTLKAIEEGIKYIDGSILGMGRGGGNLPIELLLGILQRQGNNKYCINPYLEVIEKYYLNESNRQEWGYRMQSLLSGLKNVHPNYTEELFSRTDYKINDIWKSLDSINTNYPVFYSRIH